MLKDNEKAASDTGGLLSFHNSTFSTPRYFSQVGNFQVIRDLAKQILEDIGIISLINDRGREDDE